jgi:hypothetical protein
LCWYNKRDAPVVEARAKKTAEDVAERLNAEEDRREEDSGHNIPDWVLPSA